MQTQMPSQAQRVLNVQVCLFMPSVLYDKHLIQESLRYIACCISELRLLGELCNGFGVITFWDNLARDESPLAALLNFENRNYKLCILQMC